MHCNIKKTACYSRSCHLDICVQFNQSLPPCQPTSTAPETLFPFWRHIGYTAISSSSISRRKELANTREQAIHLMVGEVRWGRMLTHTFECASQLPAQVNHLPVTCCCTDKHQSAPITTALHCTVTLQCNQHQSRHTLTAGNYCEHNVCAYLVLVQVQAEKGQTDRDKVVGLQRVRGEPKSSVRRRERAVLNSQG